MKKKVVSIMMTAALAVGMLAGCGNSDSGSSNAGFRKRFQEHIRGRKHKRICFQRSRGRGNYHNPYRMVSVRGSGKRQR